MELRSLAKKAPLPTATPWPLLKPRWRVAKDSRWRALLFIHHSFSDDRVSLWLQAFLASSPRLAGGQERSGRLLFSTQYRLSGTASGRPFAWAKKRARRLVRGGTGPRRRVRMSSRGGTRNRSAQKINGRLNARAGSSAGCELRHTLRE